jgi:hypothetical protein
MSGRNMNEQAGAAVRQKEEGRSFERPSFE